MSPATERIAAALEHARQWLQQSGRHAFDFQIEAWTAYLNGSSGLVNAPTGTGKTLAAWLGPLLEAKLGDPGRSPGGPLLLWITPLRALANDLALGLRAAADGLQVDWSVDIRTGDTSASRRKLQRRKPPQALIITPESLSLLLSYADTREQLKALRCVVVDEWHELLASKRGVQLELCLEHLRSLSPSLRTWGLSATLPNLEQACEVLWGPGREGCLVRSDIVKPLAVDSLLPDDITRFPWAGHLGTQLLPKVVAAIAAAKSTLLFTNTRSQAELWYEAIVTQRMDWLTEVAVHHGSIDRKVRQAIETRLREGSLRCVVATSSLDLGVDFSPVDQVLQLGSPKGVARLIQRAGRSGHRPDARSRVICVPTHSWELLEIAAAREGIETGRIEARRPLTLSLDVLAQHVVTLASGGGFVADHLYDEVRRTHAFHRLDRRQWTWVLDFVTRGGQALQGYPQFHRVRLEEGLHVAHDAQAARRHRMSVGTISSDTTMQVKFQTGGRIGSIEESFIGRLQPGDDFLFSGRSLRLLRVRDMTAYVSLSPQRSRHVPRWQGGRLPLSTELAALMLALLTAPALRASRHPEWLAAAPLLQLQARWSSLPSPAALLVEEIKSREGHHLYAYPFAGRQVNEGLAMLLASRWARSRPQSFAIAANDYGFELLSPEPLQLSEQSLRAGLSTANLAVDLLSSLNLSEMARRRFRDIARISGLVFPGYPGAGKSSRQLQASSSLIFDVLTNYDPANLLLDQSRVEVLEAQLEIEQLRAALVRIEAQTLQRVNPKRLTPLAFPIWADRLQSQTITTESWKERIRRAAERLEAQAARHAN